MFLASACPDGGSDDIPGRSADSLLLSHRASAVGRASERPGNGRTRADHAAAMLPGGTTMSTARTRLAAAVVTAAVAGATVLIPATAQAAPVPTSPLSVNITGPSSNWAPIRPGSKDVEYLSLEVVNSSGSAQPVRHAAAEGSGHRHHLGGPGR